MYIDDVPLTGTLNFTRLMATHIISNTSVELRSLDFHRVKFTNVDFRGLGDDTWVYLRKEIACAAVSVYPNTGTVDDIICILRRDSACTGEGECIETCQCFKLPDEWQPGLNDFYTYVLYINTCI